MLGLDHAHGLGHVTGCAAHVDKALELRSHARAEELVVVHDHDARPGHEDGTDISTSVPSSRPLQIRAWPP